MLGLVLGAGGVSGRHVYRKGRDREKYAPSSVGWRSETGNPVCWGPRSEHKHPPLGGCRDGVGSGDELGLAQEVKGRCVLIRGG